MPMVQKLDKSVELQLATSLTSTDTRTVAARLEESELEYHAGRAPTRRWRRSYLVRWSQDILDALNQAHQRWAVRLNADGLSFHVNRANESIHHGRKKFLRLECVATTGQD